MTPPRSEEGPQGTDEAPRGWAGLLDPGEQVLWQGRPDAGLTLSPVAPIQIIMGLIFMGFSLFWMSMVRWISAGMDGPIQLFPLFGLVFFFIGLWNAGGYALWRSFRRRYMFYSLTNKRAFIATNLPGFGRKLQSYPITKETHFDFEDNQLGTIWFAKQHISSKNGSVSRPIGFERIADARSVYALLRQVRREQT